MHAAAKKAISQVSTSVTYTNNVLRLVYGKLVNGSDIRCLSCWVGVQLPFFLVNS